MTTEKHDHLIGPLVTFGAPSLGEGDGDAGANVLAAMAGTLANLSRAGSGIASPGLGRLRAGGSFLVHGALSSSLVQDAVTSEVAIRQNNLIAGLRRLMGDKLADARKTGTKALEFPAGPAANVSENALFELEGRDAPYATDVRERWAEVIDSAPNPRIEDLVARPKLLVTAARASELEKQIAGVHGGRPLVALGLGRATDAAALGDICPCLLDGLLPDGDTGETVAGHLLVTDPAGVLEDVLRGGGERTKWLGRLLWLVDGAAGEGLVVSAGGRSAGGLTRMAGRFGTALSRVLAARLDNHDQGVTAHKFDLDDAQVRWVDFLKGMEGEVPGISGAARGLLATLAFGLLELGRGDAVSYTEPMAKLPVTPAGVEAFARHLVLRMAKARSNMLQTARRERQEAIARKIYAKLEGAGMTKRDIYRHLSLRAGECEELLLAMEGEGVLCCAGGRWTRVGDATLGHGFLDRLQLAG